MPQVVADAKRTRSNIIININYAHASVINAYAVRFGFNYRRLILLQIWGGRPSHRLIPILCTVMRADLMCIFSSITVIIRSFAMRFYMLGAWRCAAQWVCSPVFVCSASLLNDIYFIIQTHAHTRARTRAPQSRARVHTRCSIDIESICANDVRTVIH